MQARLFEKVIGAVITRGQLDVTYHDGSRVAFGSPVTGFPNLSIRFTDKNVPKDIMLDPRLGAAETFMDGRLVIEQGDIMELVQLLRSNRPWERHGFQLPPSFMRRLKNRLSFLATSFNEARSSKRNVAHHYDIGNPLYELMLDAGYMQYSCGYWPDEDMTLDEAQEAKLRHIASKLALNPGNTVLDIGSGWGGMAIYLARHFNVTVLGVTLSEEQLALATERAKAAGLADRIRFRLIDYRDLAAQGERFDRIVSVGMFEHVGRPQFDTFFRHCANLLDENGVMLLHTIGRFGKPGSTDAFTRKYIFPGGYIPALSETLAASERQRLMATDIETWRLHYARTLRAWYSRCLARKEHIIAMFDERFYRMWLFYLAGATAAFEHGGMCNYQIQYARSRHALPVSRDYMGDTEKALAN